MNIDDFKKLEYDGWQRVAGLYENTWASLTRQFIEPLINYAGINAGMEVLDSACGPGYVAGSLEDIGANATGIGCLSVMVGLAKKNYPGIVFIEGEAQALPFTENSFDAILMNFGILHLPQPQRALEEARRVLRNNGKFAFTVWASPVISKGAGIIREALEKFGRKDIVLPEAPDYFLFTTEAACRKVLAEADFDKDSVTFDTVTVNWHLPDENFLFEAELNAGVCTASILKQQEEHSLQQIREAVRQKMKEFKTGKGYEIPFAAHIITTSR